MQFLYLGLIHEFVSICLSHVCEFPCCSASQSFHTYLGPTPHAAQCIQTLNYNKTFFFTRNKLKLLLTDKAIQELSDKSADLRLDVYVCMCVCIMCE